MWICLKDAFLSIVVAQSDPASRLVRARVRDHITNVFPDAEVIETPRADYRYRAFVEADVVARVLADAVTNMHYTSFKDKVHDNRLQHAYMDVWAAMHRLQPPTTIHDKQL